MLNFLGPAHFVVELRYLTIRLFALRCVNGTPQKDPRVDTPPPRLQTLINLQNIIFDQVSLIILGNPLHFGKENTHTQNVSTRSLCGTLFFPRIFLEAFLFAFGRCQINIGRTSPRSDDLSELFFHLQRGCRDVVDTGVQVANSCWLCSYWHQRIGITPSSLILMQGKCPM